MVFAIFGQICLMVVERLIYKSKSFEETLDENGRMNKQKELVLQKIAGTSPSYQ